MILLISASQVVRITGMSHQCPAHYIYFLMRQDKMVITKTYFTL
jgi:hypothetical protein